MFPAEQFHGNGIRGFETIDIDEWTKGFFESKPAKLDDSAEHLILQAFDNASKVPNDRWLPTFFNPLVQSFAAPYNTQKEYLDLATDLYSARDQIRTAKPIERARVAISLLSVLTDEALYAMLLKFPSASPTWKWSPVDLQDPGCKISYEGAPVCRGDIVLSKSNAFLGMLLLFRSPYSMTFSHSALAFEDSGKLGLINADIQGRVLEGASELDTLPKVSVYRYKKGFDGPSNATSFVLRMKNFDFNFPLVPTCSSNRYFCSELVYCSFKEAGLNGSENPYSEDFWSLPGPQDKRDIDDFISRILSVSWGKIPVPSDLELNPSYEAVLHVIHIPWLPELRIRIMFMDALIHLMRDNPLLREQYIDAVNWLTNSQTQLQTILPQKVLSEFLKTKTAFNGKVTNKELVFYFHFEQVLSPEVYRELLKETEGRPVLLSDLEKGAESKIESKIRSMIRQVQLAKKLYPHS